MYMRKLLRRRRRFRHRVQLWRWCNHTIASCRFRSWLWLGGWHALWLSLWLWLRLRNIFQKIHSCISEEAKPDQRNPHAEDAQDSAARRLRSALFRGSGWFHVLAIFRLIRGVSIIRFVGFIDTV